MRKRVLLAVLVLIALSVIRVAAQFPGYGTRPQMPNNLSTGELTVPVPLQAYPPGIMFSTLLENVAVNARGGYFKLGNQMQNVFMPDGSTGRVVLSRANGTEFCHWKWELDGFGLRPPYKLFGFRNALNPDGTYFDISNMKLTEPGGYTMDFYLGEKRFYTFAFSVRTVQPANPFDGEPLYLADGPWNDWGYLYYGDADPSQNLLWKVWMREETHKQPSHKVRVEVVRDKDKKLICQSRENTSYRFRKDWVRQSFDMVNPPVKTSGGAYFKAKDLLAVDGGYTLTMKIDGAVYGVWRFKVEGGRFNYTGQTVRGAADSLTFVEGGKDAFWYKRETK